MPHIDIKVDDITVDENGNVSSAIIISSSSGGVMVILSILLLGIWCFRKFAARTNAFQENFSGTSSETESLQTEENRNSAENENSENINRESIVANSFANTNNSPSMRTFIEAATLSTSITESVTHSTPESVTLPITTTQQSIVPQTLTSQRTGLNGSYWSGTVNMSASKRTPMQRD